MSGVLNDGYAYRTPVQRGGESVLAFLTARFTHSGAEVWAARLAAGEVEVDGVAVTGSEVLLPGQTLVWHRPPWPEPVVPLGYTVLYHDDSLLAVNKPSGLPTLPAGGFLKHTLLSVVRRDWPGASPLHRLGRGTSGVVLFALDTAAGSVLAREWREHAVRKTYRALASGVIAADTLTLTTPIGPQPHPRLGKVFAASPDGKAAHSVVRVLERRSCPAGGLARCPPTPGRSTTDRSTLGRSTLGRSTLCEVDIRTGRPHQIRIHLAAAGHPLVGDPLYAPGGLPHPDLPGLPGDLGYWLHAHTLSFTHPATGHDLTVTASPPPELLDEAER